jgi:DNA-directed RNA polymerase specialized sigma24 family protein
VEATDALLTARLAAGDDRALAEAFDQLGPAVYGAALRVLGEWTAAQDVAQMSSLSYGVIRTGTTPPPGRCAPT